MFATALPKLAAIQIAVTGTTSVRGGGDTYAGDTLNIGPVTLTPEYDFNKLMDDIDRYRQTKRIQRGISLI